MTDDFTQADSDLFEILLKRPPVVPMPVVPQSREDREEFIRQLGRGDPRDLDVLHVAHEIGQRIRDREA